MADILERHDAHIHLFEGGYRASLTARPGLTVDEAALYASLMKDHNVREALIVGYAAHEWCRDNTAHLAKMAAAHAWVRPVSFVHLDRSPPTRYDLELLRDQKFVGLSFYVFGEESRTALSRMPDELWKFAIDHRWLISVNSRGTDWGAWQPILSRHPELRVLVSHLGLPPRQRVAPSADEARRAIGDVLGLAQFKSVRVKLSGFYALTDPGHEYPHRAAWPYVEALAQDFGIDRLLWASDFSPHLDWLSFPQTFGLFDAMLFLGDAARGRILGANLAKLLGEVQSS